MSIPPFEALLVIMKLLVVQIKRGVGSAQTHLCADIPARV